MTNYDILKEYEAHKTPVPSYKEYARLKEVERKKGKLVNVNYKIKQENQKLNRRLLDMMDLLQKSYFYLNAVADGKVKTEHLEQVKTLTVLIDNAIGEKK